MDKPTVTQPDGELVGHTPGPWRHSKKSNLGNLIEGPSGKEPQYEFDDGYRAICTVQPCTSSRLAADEDSNLWANIRLIKSAPTLAAENASLKAVLAEAAGTLEHCLREHGATQSGAKPSEW